MHMTIMWSIMTAIKTAMLCILYDHLGSFFSLQFGYNQIALTSQALDHAQSSNTYSHDHPYPLRQRFFIGPTENTRGAVKCEVIVSDTLTPRQKLTSTVVIPYSPTSKDATPEPSSRSSTRPPSPTNSRLHLRSTAPSETGSLSLSLSSRNPSHTSESVV